MAVAEASDNTDVAESYPPPAYSWYVVVVLTLAYTVSFIDRQIMALMVEPIRRDLGISDTQMSLLLGLAFAVFYTLLGIPLARLADRYSRRMIITWGIAIWCLMTAGCGLARNYAQLFVARIGVGVGEAALSPSALSMISDYFPQETRGRAVSFYTMGIAMGVGLAMIIGGQIIAMVSEAPPVVLPVVGELFAWQTVFLVVGLPGLIMAVLMKTVKEPRRQEGLKAVAGRVDADHLPLTDVVNFLGQRWRMYATHFLGMSVVGILSYGFYAWIPTMFIRTWGWSIRDIGFAYGIVTLATGPLAVVMAAWLAENFMKKGYQDAHMRAAFCGALFGIVGAILTPLMPTPGLSVLMLIPMSAGTMCTTAAGLSALMIVTPNQMRAQASALYFFVINLLGLTVGPTGIALFTDYVFRDDALLRYSVACVAVLAGVFATGFLIYNMGQYRKMYVESQAWSSVPS